MNEQEKPLSQRPFISLTRKEREQAMKETIEKKLKEKLGPNAMEKFVIIMDGGPSKKD